MTAKFRRSLAAIVFAGITALALVARARAQNQSTAATQPPNQFESQSQPSASAPKQNPDPENTQSQLAAPSHVPSGPDFSRHSQSPLANTQDPPAQVPLRDYSKGPSWFRNPIGPYKQQPVNPVSLENSPRVRELIHDESARGGARFGSEDISLGHGDHLALD